MAQLKTTVVKLQGEWKRLEGGLLFGTRITDEF